MRVRRRLGYRIGIVLSMGLAAAAAAAGEKPSLPGGLAAGELLYSASLGDADSVAGWQMEGPGKVAFKDGWMHMQSPGEKMHHVFWCPERFPESFIAQWQAQNVETDAGLCIVFFAAAGADGRDVLDEKLPDRDGTFSQYTRGKIRCYHASYYANAAHNPDRQQTNLRKNPGFHLVQEGKEGIPTNSEKVHTITLARQGPRIGLWVDDRKVIDWTDKATTGGKPHGGGAIGFRQMKWTHFRYRDFRVWAAEGSKADGAFDAPAALPKLSGIEIDGRGDDWAAEAGYRPQLHRHLAKGRYEPDPAPKVTMGWDEKGLLVKLRLADDRWVEADSIKKLWMLDGVELYLARAVGSPQAYQVVVSPGMAPGQDELRKAIYDKRLVKRSPVVADVARTRDGNAVTIEARLGWDSLGIAPAVGETAGVQVMVNDHDANGESYDRTAHSVWYRGLGTAQDSRKMKPIRLAGPRGRTLPAASQLRFTPESGYVVEVTAAEGLAGKAVTLNTEKGPHARAALAGGEAGQAAATLKIARPEAFADGRFDVVIDGVVIGRHGLGDVAGPAIWAAVKQAGNAEREPRRYAILKQLAERDDLPPAFRAHLKTLLPTVAHWSGHFADDKGKTDAARAAENGYLCNFFYHKINPDNDWPGYIPAESPLYPLRAYYRGRALVWRPIQSGKIRRTPARREQYYAPARELLAIADRAYPENRVIDMWVGQPYPWPTAFQPDPNAPDWANLQREGLEKLVDLLHWWIDHRQLPDGQFGGGWGDDVEMWRWWSPVLVAFDDPKVVGSWDLISEAIFKQPHLKHGYTSHMSDVEHTGEDTSDTITPMLFLHPDDPKWQKRAMRIVELARDLWMGTNQRGQWMFKSTYFNVHKNRTDPQVACDTVYHPRALQPALIHWMRTDNKAVGELIPKWMDTWVDATARAERGKPAGITPSAIHWPDGNVGGLGENWWLPENYGAPKLYMWPSYMSAMTKTLLLTYHMTGQEKYLAPIRSMAEIRRKFLKNPPLGLVEPGSAAWCATTGGGFGNGMARFLPETLGKYRLLTGSKEFDDLLAADASGYMKMRMGLGREALVADLRENAKAFAVNRPAYTYEMRWTDRVLTFNGRWGNEGNGWDWPVPNVSALYESATGDPGNPRYFPMMAVRWRIQPRAFAALVTESGTDAFAAELYNFRKTPRTVKADLYLLNNGAYELTVADAAGKVLARQAVQVAGPRTAVRFDLPPGQLCTVKVTAE